MTNINKMNQSGRSMVEMLGVLAIIGVLSVGGIAGYTMAMNKHRANEILNAASIRAMVVSTQIQNGTSPTLAEFTDNKIGSATFGTDVKNTTGTGTWTKGTDNQFSLTLSGVDTKICNQMKNIAGENSIIKAWGDNCTFLTYNNDLGSGSTTTGGGNTNPDIKTCANGATPVLKTYKTGSCCVYTTKEMCPETPVPECTPNSDCNMSKENCAGSWAQQESEYHFNSNETYIPDDEKMSICCLEGKAHCGGAGCLCAPLGASVDISTRQSRDDDDEYDRGLSIICDTGRAICPYQGSCICVPQGMGGCCADDHCILIPPDRDGGCEGANSEICDVGEKWCDTYCAETCEIEEE